MSCTVTGGGGSKARTDEWTLKDILHQRDIASPCSDSSHRSWLVRCRGSYTYIGGGVIVRKKTEEEIVEKEGAESSVLGGGEKNDIASLRTSDCYGVVVPCIMPGDPKSTTCFTSVRCVGISGSVDQENLGRCDCSQQ
ncbi:hypothetical protein O3P69_018050 [Scylla paramamosain]|uniref:Uncharacterized protein n=1 Tax=Scylla paramamosain TaxID=85552 RepID=A0AAW0THE5_SCYPA